MFGQPVTYNLKFCVPFDILQQAIMTFAKTGDLDRGLAWKEP